MDQIDDLVARLRKRVQSTHALHLDSLEPGSLPKLGVLAQKNSKEVYADVCAHLSALIVDCDNRILYAECVCPSSATAHALMGCVHDNFPGEIIWKYMKPGSTWDFTKLQAPQSPACMDVRLNVPGWHNNVHHVAMLDKSGALILCQDDDTLWRKIKALTTCPVLDEWGLALVPQIKESGMLYQCESFGLKDNQTPYVLAQDALATFDKLVANHVRTVGGLKRGVHHVKNTA